MQTIEGVRQGIVLLTAGNPFHITTQIGFRLLVGQMCLFHQTTGKPQGADVALSYTGMLYSFLKPVLRVLLGV
jgi:hypothetical protein